MSTKEYFECESKLYYEDYLNHEPTKKVRGIVLNSVGQILLLHSKRHKGYSIPGGKIEKGESIRDAVIREVFEETGAEIVPIKIVGKYYHTTKNFRFEDKVFDSARVEYFYFCKFKSFKAHNLGLEGEFDEGDVDVSFMDYEDTVKAKLFARDKSMIERAINEFLLYHADDVEFDEKREDNPNKGKNSDEKLENMKKYNRQKFKRR